MYQRALNQPSAMKTWLLIGLISLGWLLASCQPEERTTIPTAASTKGGWVVYPPLSAMSAAQRSQLHRAVPDKVRLQKIKIDSLRAAQLGVN